MIKKILFVLVVLFIAFAVVNCAGTFDVDGEWKWPLPNPPQVLEADFFTAAGIAAGAASLIGGLASAGMNYRSQQNAYSNDMRLNAINWLREDTAVQRRAQDLKNAGLSKTLAAGDAATTSVAVHPNAPQMDNLGGKVSDALSAAQQVQAIYNAREENANMRKSREMMDAQINKENALADLYGFQAKKSASDVLVNNATISKILKENAETDERIRGYPYQRAKIAAEMQKLYYDSMISALDVGLIRSTGLGHNSASMPAVVSKILGRAKGGLDDLFGRGEWQGVKNFSQLLDSFK